jgi:hypothetical protein
MFFYGTEVQRIRAETACPWVLTRHQKSGRQGYQRNRPAMKIIQLANEF